MNQNLNTTIHELVTPELLHTLDVALTGLETAAAFAVGLSSRDRARLRTYGPANEGFVPELISAAEQYSSLVPPDRSPAEIEKRRVATVELTKRAVRCANVCQRLSDTARVAGDGTVGTALDLYHILKRLGNVEGLDASIGRLSRRFAQRPRTNGSTTTGPTPAGSSQPTTAGANIAAFPTAPAAQAA